MQSIFDIKFPIEQKVKEEVILKFATKQGGSYNIFSYYWQCFVWAATIGFLRNEKRPLATGIERIFSLGTIRSSGGEKAAQGLICMCIARYGSVDILKEPEEFIRSISEYANGGFYHILQLMQTGENTFNDFEKVKQEIFSRNYDNASSTPVVAHIEEEEKQEDIKQDIIEEVPARPSDNPQQRVRSRWTVKENGELRSYFNQGLTIEQLAGFFNRTEQDVENQLKKLELI